MTPRLTPWPPKRYNPDADCKDTRRRIVEHTGGDGLWLQSIRNPMDILGQFERVALDGRAGVNEVLRGQIMGLTAAQWTRTRGVYRFDPTLAEAIDQTPVEGLTDDVLTRLPEWSIYIEAEREVGPDWMHGGYVTFIPDPDGRTAMILFLTVLASGSQAEPWYYLPSRISVRIGAPYSFADRLKAGDDRGSRHTIPESESVLLARAAYLCSTEPDVRNARDPKARPVRKKSNHPVRVWDVGVRFGSAFRAALADHEQQAAASAPGQDRQRPRIHVRRAHWHTVLSGPRNQERTRELRWFPPVIVNAEGEDLPTVIWRAR